MFWPRNKRRSRLRNLQSGGGGSSGGDSDRVLQASSIAGESENMEVVAMVEYVIVDTGNVASEVNLLWTEETYNQTVPITLFFSFIWIVFTAIIL